MQLHINYFLFQPIFNPSAGIHPTTEVNQKLLQQIRLEMQDHVIIKSIIPEPANTDTIIQAVSDDHIP